MCVPPTGRLWAGLVVAATLIGNPAFAETNIRFSLDGKVEGPLAPFVVAVDKGYYKATGLNVTVEPGAGSLESITRVASGRFEMGFADVNALIKYRDANPEAPVDAVMMVYNQPPFAIIGRKSRGIAVPKDLEGKRLGAPALDPAFAQWPIFVKANRIDASKVKIENVGIPVRGPMLAAGQVDAVTGISFSTYVNLKERGVPADDVVMLLMADYGVDLYGSAIIVNQKFAEKNPDAVKAFLRAVIMGLNFTVKNPSGAIASVVARNDTAKVSTELERLNIALKDNILTPEVKKNGFGGVDLERFEKSIDQLGTAYDFKNKPKAAALFDPSFLPPLPERKIN